MLQCWSYIFAVSDFRLRHSAAVPAASRYFRSWGSSGHASRAFAWLSVTPSGRVPHTPALSADEPSVYQWLHFGLRSTHRQRGLPVAPERVERKLAAILAADGSDSGLRLTP